MVSDPEAAHAVRSGMPDLPGMLNHPHIVRGLEFGLDGSKPYLVMEYVDRQREPGPSAWSGKGGVAEPEAIHLIDSQVSGPGATLGASAPPHPPGRQAGQHSSNLGRRGQAHRPRPGQEPRQRFQPHPDDELSRHPQFHAPSRSSLRTPKKRMPIAINTPWLPRFTCVVTGEIPVPRAKRKCRKGRISTRRN